VYVRWYREPDTEKAFSGYTIDNTQKIKVYKQAKTHDVQPAPSAGDAPPGLHHSVPRASSAAYYM